MYGVSSTVLFDFPDQPFQTGGAVGAMVSLPSLQHFARFVVSTKDYYALRSVIESGVGMKNSPYRRAETLHVLVCRAILHISWESL